MVNGFHQESKEINVIDPATESCAVISLEVKMM